MLRSFNSSPWDIAWGFSPFDRLSALFGQKCLPQFHAHSAPNEVQRPAFSKITTAQPWVSPEVRKQVKMLPKGFLHWERDDFHFMIPKVLWKFWMLKLSHQKDDGVHSHYAFLLDQNLVCACSPMTQFTYLYFNFLHFCLLTPIVTWMHISKLTIWGEKKKKSRWRVRKRVKHSKIGNQSQAHKNEFCGELIQEKDFHRGSDIWQRLNEHPLCQALY